MKIQEPKSPQVGDSVKCILKQVEIVIERFMGDSMGKGGKITKYTGPKMFTQDIRVFTIFENGSSFSNRTNNSLPEQDKDKFPEKGYFEKIEEKWVSITKDEFYKKFN